MAQFSIHVPDVDAEGKSYYFPLSPDWIASALESTDLRADMSAGEGCVEVFAQRSGDDIVVTGKIQTQIFADCVRCLEDAPVGVRVEIGALFTAKGEGHRPEPELHRPLDLGVGRSPELGRRHVPERVRHGRLGVRGERESEAGVYR